MKQTDVDKLVRLANFGQSILNCDNRNIQTKSEYKENIFVYNFITINIIIDTVVNQK